MKNENIEEVRNSKNNPEQSRTKLTGPATGCLCTLLALVVLLAILANIAIPFQIVWALLTGWVDFLIRTIPKLSGNLSIAAMALTCSALALLFGQLFLRWLAASIAKHRSEVIQPWKFRWTLCGFASVWILFLIGMAAGGIVHQIGWISKSPEPLAIANNISSRTYFQQASLMRTLERTLEHYHPDLNAALEDFRTSMDERDSSRNGPSLRENYRFFVITKADDPTQAEGTLTFPRKRPKNRNWTGEIKLDGEPTKIKTEEKLRDYLDQYHKRLIAL